MPKRISNSNNIVNNSAKKKGTETDKKIEEARAFIKATVLEPARAFIEATSVSHGSNFAKTVELICMTAAAKKCEKGTVASSCTYETIKLIQLLTNLHGIVAGKGIKSKISSIKRMLKNDTNYDA